MSILLTFRPPVSPVYNAFSVYMLTWPPFGPIVPPLGHQPPLDAAVEGAALLDNVEGGAESGSVVAQIARLSLCESRHAHEIVPPQTAGSDCPLKLSHHV
jgi:hypothetical protein